MNGRGREVLSPAEMGEADRLAARSIPSAALMENAGRAVARAAFRRFGPGRTLVLCGPGNNGGDGYVAARLLAARGWPVTVAQWKRVRDGTDAERAAGRWRGRTVAIDGSGDVVALAARADLVVDALFGAGLRHPLEDPLAAVLARGRRVLAVDLPSGLDGATGMPRGAVRPSDATVTFFRPKPGHLLEPGRTLCGALTVADIGLPEDVLGGIGVRTWHNGPGLFRLRSAGTSDHKYARGVVAVCGGAAMSGAALLAAEAARRAGAGLVRLAALGGAATVRNAEPGLIVDEGPLSEMLGDRRRGVWVCGPGLTAEEAAACLSLLLGAPVKLVVDGGALTVRSGDPGALRGAAVLTPHDGEFGRLFGGPGEDRLGAARAAASRTGAVVVLKGASTVIAAPDGRAAINTHATPALATAGSGDTLAGVIAAMLANGLDPFEAAAAGVWLHGDAARRAGPGLIAEDLADHLAAALDAAREAE